MARKETLNARAARLNRPVVLQIELSVSTLADLDELAGRVGKTRQAALQDAAFEWTWRNRRRQTRNERIRVEQAMRGARDEVPLGPLLDRFRAQMEAASVRPVDIAYGSVRPRASLPRMESTSKQVKADLEAGFYDEIAEIAAADDRSIAYLIRKGLEKVAAEHRAAQPQESSIAAA